MTKKQILLPMLFLGIASNLFCQDTISSEKAILKQSAFEGSAQKLEKVDSSAIESFADKFVVKLNIDTGTDTYTILNRTDGSKVSIAPNNNYRLFLSLDYEFLGFSYGFSPTFFAANNDDDLKGESSFSDFIFRAALGHWIQGFQISTTEGYYIENTGDFVPDWEEGIDPYIQIPDFKSEIYGMSTSYVFNPNFSFRNLLYQTEWQKKSAGSFIPTLFYSYDRFTYTIADEKFKDEIVPVRLALAFYYTLVVKENWFLGGSLSPSLSVNFSKSSVSKNNIQSISSSTEFSQSLEGSLQIGYASKKVVFGGGFKFDVNSYDVEALKTVVNDKTYSFIYFGYRFNTPGFIDRTYSKFADKVGL
jgi:hypothetical protein